jgi:hypothetical protein
MKLFKPILILVALAALLAPWLSSQLQAAELTDADRIVELANRAAFYAGEDGRTEARMTIIDSQGRKQVRQFTLLRRNREEGGDQDLMVFFSRPSDVRDTVFRVVRHPDSDDERWLYLPGLDLVKRIAAGDNRTSFVGSHFFYEDVSGRNIHDDRFELVGSDDQLYQLVGRPKHPSSVEFSRYRVWIDKRTLLPMRIEYEDPQGQLYRRIEVIAVEEIQGHPTVTRSRVSDLLGGGHTLLEFRHTAYDLSLPASLFTERSLRNPPRQWLKRP